MDPVKRVRALYAPMLEAAITDSGVGRDAVELCRRRIRQLLGGDEDDGSRALARLDDDVVRELSAWPTSPVFADHERALLVFTERFAMDPAGARDEEVAPVREQLGEHGMVAFTVVLGLLEGLERLPGATAHRAEEDDR